MVEMEIKTEFYWGGFNLCNTKVLILIMMYDGYPMGMVRRRRTFRAWSRLSPITVQKCKLFPDKVIATLC
jgi:hypothetical protein